MYIPFRENCNIIFHNLINKCSWSWVSPYYMWYESFGDLKCNYGSSRTVLHAVKTRLGQPWVSVHDNIQSGLKTFELSEVHLSGDCTFTLQCHQTSNLLIVWSFAQILYVIRTEIKLIYWHGCRRSQILYRSSWQCIYSFLILLFYVYASLIYFNQVYVVWHWLNFAIAGEKLLLTVHKVHGAIILI